MKNRLFVWLATCLMCLTASGLAGAADKDRLSGLQNNVEELQQQIELTPGPEGPPDEIGPREPQGPIGIQGPQGVQGMSGADGIDGIDGQSFEQSQIVLNRETSFQAFVITEPNLNNSFKITYTCGDGRRLITAALEEHLLFVGGTVIGCDSCYSVEELSSDVSADGTIQVVTYIYRPLMDFSGYESGNMGVRCSVLCM